MPHIDGLQSVQPQSSLQQNAPGQLGARQVRAGQSDLPRLDRIKGAEPPKGNFLTRAFETVPTKMDRTSRSVDKHTSLLLDTLDRPAGKSLDGKTLLGQIATLRNHYAQMSQLSGRTVDPSATLQLAVAGRLGGMDNEKLMNVYRSFLSEDLTMLRSALRAEIFNNPGNIAAQNSLEDLGTIEAMLMMEISGRVARGSGEDVPPLQDRLAAHLKTEDHASLIAFQSTLRTDAAAQTGRLNDKNLETLVEAGARSANLHDRSMANDASARLERKGIDLSARQAGDALRDADLTMNFDLCKFLRIDGDTATIDSADSIRNMFHWGADPSNGQVGVLKRDTAERQFFGSLEKADLDPDSRPTYGALNLGRESKGSAFFYGASFFVLKPEVKQRSTYTMDDTFNIPQCKVTPEGLAKFDSELPALLSRLSDSARTFLSQEGNIDKLKAALQEKGSFSTNKLEDNVKAALGNPTESEMNKDDIDRLALFTQQVFIDRHATQAHIAGYDSMENLLTHVDDDRLSRMMLSALSPDTRNIGIGGYVEAQIHGRVAFDRDVQAMRVSVHDVETAAKNGEDDPPKDVIEKNKDAIRKKLADFCTRNGIELTYYDPEDESINLELVDNVDLVKEFERAHVDSEVLKAKRNEALNAFMDPSDAGQDGFTGLLKEMKIDVQTLAAEDLGMVRDFVRQQLLEHSDGNGHRFDKPMAQSITEKAIRNLLLKQPMLATVRSLDMPAPHKEAFRAFVLASSLDSPAMLTSLHQSTRAGVALLQRLAGAPSLSEAGQLEPTLRELQAFVHGCRDALDSLTTPDKPWGRDDLMLYADRTLSLSASLFTKDGSPAAPLYSQLTSSDAMVLGDALQFDRKADEEVDGGAWADTVENTRRTMADALKLLTLKVGREAGHAAPDVEEDLAHEFTATSPDKIPPAVRQAMTALNLL